MFGVRVRIGVGIMIGVRVGVCVGNPHTYPTPIGRVHLSDHRKKGHDREDRGPEWMQRDSSATPSTLAHFPEVV